MDLLIASPIYDRKLNVETVVSITSTVVQLLQQNVQVSFFHSSGCALIEHVRNSIAAEFLARKDKTHLLCVDADMEWNPSVVLRLLKADVPFAAAPYVGKVYANAPTQRYKPRDLDAFHAATVRWNVEFADPGIMKGERKLKEIRNGFAKASRVGLGLALLKRSMLEQMVIKYSDTEYKWDDSRDSTPSATLRYFGLFNTLKNENGYLIGEDYSFCDRWVRGCGGEIWVDIDARISHHGSHRYTGSLQESLRIINIHS